ncbi:MAG: hypothetical protein OEU32_17210, partial [Acidimicrobiia bacterium]|nr:hypothetical protein [Acidimicrobiia bacterium]
MPDSLSGDRETGRHAVQLRSRTGGATRIEITRLGHRPAVVASVGDAEHPSSLRAVDGANLAVAADTAVDRRIPLVFHLSSTGADVHEGVAATHGWGTAARALVRASGIVPTVVCVDGPAVSGPALFLGIADFSIMTAKAYAFVSGPRMVEQYTGVPINPESLGGAMLHARSDGAASFVVADRAATDDLVIELLTLLPTDTDSLPPIYDTDDPADRPNPDLLDMLPVSPQGSYDVRDIIREIVDDGEMLESRAAWAPNIITTLSTIAGRPVGIVANQPQSLAG